MQTDVVAAKFRISNCFIIMPKTDENLNLMARVTTKFGQSMEIVRIGEMYSWLQCEITANCCT